MAKKRTGVDTGTKAMVFLGFLGIIVLFVGMVFLTDVLASVSTYISLALFVVVITYYTSDAVALMYDFYETDRPIGRFIPFICEFYLLDVKLRRICYSLTGLVIALVVLARLPYSVKAVFGESFALSSSFYLMFAALVILVILEITIGVGLISTIGDICNDWRRIVKTDVGSIKRLSIFAFIPFVRVFAIYALRKPLDTLVTFRNETYSSDAEVDVVSEDDDDYDDDYDEGYDDYDDDYDD